MAGPRQWVTAHGHFQPVVGCRLLQVHIKNSCGYSKGLSYFGISRSVLVFYKDEEGRRLIHSLLVSCLWIRN